MSPIPIALYQAKQLEDTNLSTQSATGIRLLMHNSADILRRQHAAIEALQAQVSIVRHNIAEFHADQVRAEDAIKNMECALLGSSNA